MSHDDLDCRPRDRVDGVSPVDYVSQRAASESTDRPSRRRFLRSLAAIGSVGPFAGCLGGRETEPATGSPTDTPTAAATDSPAERTRPSTTLGVETLLRERAGLLADERIGLITNPSGVDSTLTSTIDLLYEHEQFDLRKLFSPEHGIRGAAQAGEEVDDGVDEKTGLPVVSLYGDTRRMQPSMLSNVDAVVFDVQDVGARFYTYIYTLAYAMETIGGMDKRIVVLDRPNPVAPLSTAGSRIDEENASFIGAYRLPILHRMTVGELARYFNGEFGMDAALDVVRMRGWDRSMWYDDTGLPWVPPSPNMPTTRTATVYPGMVYFEATTLSEGRGTTKPFEYVGAPWIDGSEWADTLNGFDLAGVQFRPVGFEPTFDDHEGTRVGGVQTHVLDRSRFRPVRVGLTMLVSTFLSHPETEWLSWGDTYAIDFRANGSDLRRTIDDADPDTNPLALADSVRSGWTKDIEEFRRVREPYLLYD